MTETDDLGHIKLSRRLFKRETAHPFWTEDRKFSRFEAWVYLIQKANFAPRVREVCGHLVDLARGEFVVSLRYLATKFKWSLKVVRSWVRYCEKGAQLRAQRETPVGTVYLIVNYDSYQNPQRKAKEPKGTATGTDGAQAGHKEETRETRETSKAVTTLSVSVRLVLDHYTRTHPKRRPGPKEIAAIGKALDLGYATGDLCAAIDGNAADDWHRSKHKHELTYVLRDNAHIDNFRGMAEPDIAPGPVVDAFGCLTAYGERITRPA